MAGESSPVYREWVAGKIAPAARLLLGRLLESDDVVHVAVMPDAHASTDVCVGTALATRRLIYPSAVGGDIGCGISVVAFDGGADLLDSERHAMALLDALREAVPIHRHRKPRELPATWEPPPVARRDAAVQLGTLGGGNHFLEFQSDEEDRLWLMVHSGSRAVGQAVRDRHVARASRTRSGLPALDAQTDAGRVYLAEAAWAERYASENRRAMVDAASHLVRRLFNVAPLDATYHDASHNHVRRETHFGERLWVHRKGASSADAGERGFVPGSMGTPSFHTEGRGEPAALRSSSHGAGRAMSRTEARRRVTARDVARQLRDVWHDPHADVREESPAAYKDVLAVMRAQRDLTRITNILRPLLSYKGGSRTRE